jgi:hypothetical protein
MSTESNEGKGKPTPSRKEAEAARKQGLAIPKGSKDARRAARDRQRQANLDARSGLMRGDEKYFPAKDRGPVRKAVRDWVDSRRTVGEVFVPMAFVVMLTNGFLQNSQFKNVITSAWIMMMVLLLLDCTYIGIRLHLAMSRQFPNEAERKGIVAYGIMRAIQIRKFRIPPATIRTGGRPLKEKKKK